MYKVILKDDKYELMQLSDGWMPTYNDPDNSGCHPMSEPTGVYYQTIDADKAYWSTKTYGTISEGVDFVVSDIGFGNVAIPKVKGRGGFNTNRTRSLNL